MLDVIEVELRKRLPRADAATHKTTYCRRADLDWSLTFCACTPVLDVTTGWLSPARSLFFAFAWLLSNFFRRLSPTGSVGTFSALPGFGTVCSLLRTTLYIVTDLFRLQSSENRFKSGGVDPGER